ncbi:E3 ubiquitin-protein ligase ARIH1 [Hypsibius exemplaris]|uniref:RBR-type E3 ubiquitin transferase n=1 Tax=Hypsibius exemplaris TaxID=2072580 RepID=A0A1W0WVN8_HYPEX|nr:E3 ubiquitin-protein ligase ARIH1 [Hypsibius exemplaris]
MSEVDNLANYTFSDEEGGDNFDVINNAMTWAADEKNGDDVQPGQPATGGGSPGRRPAKKPKVGKGDAPSTSFSSKASAASYSEINVRSFSRPRVGLPDSGLYSVVLQQAVRAAMREIVHEVAVIIEVPASTTQLLLNHLKWDKDRTIERYYEDSERLYKDAHVVDPSADVPVLPVAESCDICYNDIDHGTSKGAGCGHTFCLPCWEEYLTAKITKENVCSKIGCPAHKCPTLLDSDFILELLVISPAVQEKYQTGLVNDFVQVTKNLRWCPGKDCEGVVRLTTASSDWICISCPHCRETSCFLCGEPWHEPVLCQLLKRWLKKKQDDSETGNWIATNTKDCPKCGVAIEKNGGCNQMHCTEKGCLVAFCWICMKVGSAYQPHGCNKYEEKADTNSRRAVLERYLFYDTRYNVHEQSLKLETKLIGSVESRMEEMVTHGKTWVEVQFLRKAVESLNRCRRTLMYTYAFAFHLQRNAQQELFEQNQADLEQATEKLSGFLERQIDDSASVLDVDEMRRNILDSMTYCERRREILSQHVYEGYEAESWDFNV